MWQIAGDENFHFAYMWQVVTGKSHFGGTYSTVRGYNPADYLPHISEMTFSHRPNTPPVRQIRHNLHTAFAKPDEFHWPHHDFTTSCATYFTRIWQLQSGKAQKTEQLNIAYPNDC